MPMQSLSLLQYNIIIYDAILMQKYQYSISTLHPLLLHYSPLHHVTHHYLMSRDGSFSCVDGQTTGQ